MMFPDTRNTKQSREYALKSIIYHCGFNLEDSHYTADVNVKTLFNKAHLQKWMHCNDHTVDWVSQHEVLNRGIESERTGIVPYILFYERSDTVQ